MKYISCTKIRTYQFPYLRAAYEIKTARIFQTLNFVYRGDLVTALLASHAME